MTITIDFLHRYIWGSTSNNLSNRPYSEVWLYGPHGSQDIFALVDSGADYAQFDDAFASSLGISLTGSDAAPHTVICANGSTSTMTLVSNVDLEIEGNLIQTEVLFAPNVPSLIGRVAITHAIEFGMDDKGWLYR